MISNKEILSIDLGNFNSVFFWLEQESKKVDFQADPFTPEPDRQALFAQTRSNPGEEGLHSSWQGYRPLPPTWFAGYFGKIFKGQVFNL